jgi:ABC-type multidrug transport system fused ATPase/permease subunit
MDRNIFRYILRHSLRPQVIILTLTGISFPFLYATLELPKKIINEALADSAGGSFLGRHFPQVEYLFLLCGVFLLLVLINGGFKYVINVYQGIVAERMLRRLRYDLYSRILRFPLPHFRRISQGEIVTMITAEVEAIGGFMGDAFALPAFQGGTLLTILAFMFAQDPIMGLAAISLYPIQMYIIPKLQRQVNALGKLRVRQVRRLSERLGETVAGVRDIRANDASQFERARFSNELGVIFEIRYKIYKKKFFIKFLNNFLAQLGPFFFFSIGGYLVIRGNLTLGALVAVIAAHEKLYAPWKELLTYYQLLWDSQIKFEQVVAQFDPPGLRDEALQSADPEEAFEARGEMRVANLTVTGEDGEIILDGVDFSVHLPARIALVGPAGSGKEELTMVLSNLLDAASGRVLINGHDVLRLPEAVTGRAMTYVGYPAQIFGGTIADNLFFGLKHRPVRPPQLEGALAETHKHELHEAKRSGNSPYDSAADWIDYAALGLSGPEEMAVAAVRALSAVQLDRDIYQLGLRGTIDPEAQPELAASFLEARRAMGERLEDPRLGRLVEVFDPEKYNQNSTLAENLLFGTPIGDTFDIDRLAAQPYVRRVFDQAGLTDALLEVGLKVASTMVELFADLPPDHEYFRQFSFISADELPEYRALVSRADPARLEALTPADRERLIALPLRLIPARHRLGLIDEALQARVLHARRLFREQLPAELRGCVAFFEADRYNTAASLQDNILFGKIAYGQAQAGERMGDLISEVLSDLGLRERVVEVGLQAQSGVGGSRLSLGQRQKLALARAILKRPQMLILYDATGPLDPAEQIVILDNLLHEFDERTLIWALNQSEWAAKFDQVLVMQKGRVIEQGRYDQLAHGSALHPPVAAE